MERRSPGPRAKLKTQQSREIAQTMMLEKRLEIEEQQNDSPYVPHESTTQSSQAHAATRIAKPSCLDVSSEDELKKFTEKGNGREKEAVTYWSDLIISGSQPNSTANAPPLFAKRTSFSHQKY